MRSFAKLEVIYEDAAEGLFWSGTASVSMITSTHTNSLSEKNRLELLGGERPDENQIIKNLT